MATKKQNPKPVAKSTKRSAPKRTVHKKVIHKKSDKRTITIKVLVIVIVIAIAGIIIMKLVGGSTKDEMSTATNSTGTASLLLESSNTNPKVGEKVTMSLYSESGDILVNVAQVAFTYPSNKLQLIAIDSNSSAYPIKAFEGTYDGSIEIARGVLGGINDKKLIAKFEFLTKAPGTVSFAYNKERSMLVSETDNQNIINANRLATTSLEVTN